MDFLISFIESNLILLDIIKPIKYKRHNMIIAEIKEIILPEVFKNNKYEYLANKTARPAEIIGLNIQLEISNTTQDTCNSLIK